jgi:hypothetical protein
LSISSISFTISFLSIFPSSRVFLFMFIQFYLVRDSQSTTLWSNALPWWVLVVVKHEFRHTLHIRISSFNPVTGYTVLKFLLARETKKQNRSSTTVTESSELNFAFSN